MGTAPADRLQATLDAQLGKGHVHNLIAAVQSHDRTVDFVGAAGIADPRTGAAMTPDTPFFIASVTKMFTAAIAMGLHGQGRLDLDAPISRYLPDALTRGIHVLQGTDHGPRIKVRELLGQTSGLADYETGRPRGQPSVIDELKTGVDRALDLAGAVELVRRLTPRFPPGTPGRAHYSNLNYRLLGAVLESVTGQPMAACFQERICAPLGLRRTVLLDPAAPRREPAPAAVHYRDAPANITAYLSSNGPSGGLVSTAGECMTFLRAFFEGRLFDGALLPAMTRWNRIFFPMSYGYGLMRFQLPRLVWPTRLPELVGHVGTTGAFAFTCPSSSTYLVGTVDQVSPSTPIFLAMRLLRALR